MFVQKTIKAKIFGLTTTKGAILQQEYDCWQSCIRGNAEVPLYSATKQQAGRLLRSLGRRFDRTKMYPMVLRNDCIKVEKAKDTTWSKWWFKVPVANLRGGLWCPIQMPNGQLELLGENIRECKLIRKGDHWSVHIVIQKEVPEALLHPSQPILAVDLGEVRPATAVLLRDGKIAAHILATKDVRGVRMHYNWLRQRLGEKKCLDTIRKVGRAERRQVDASLHRLSKEIVQMAKDNDAVIVMGDLTGIRERSLTKGRKFRAKIARMPSFRVAQFIEYKANWAGVSVFSINEAYTSKTCHVCGGRGKRPHQGLFLCDCGSQYNADLNGAINIGRRFRDQVFGNSGLFDSPPNSGDVKQC
ncbi:MAG: transposase [Methanomassiliicoccus sp.]|nr:transposase [Methanomassiliicoccus sp.]